jgi:alkylhydroperoxidase family enzyme
MANITNEHQALVKRILEGDGRAPHAQRRAAFDNSGLTGPLRTLTEKMTKHAYKVTDEDIAAARSSGLTEDQIFELAVCAAVGQATRQYETALAALDAATGGNPHASRHSR